MAHNNEPRKRVSITGITSDIRTKYHIQTGEIGHGHYGTVRKCSDRETGEVFAVKTIKKEKVGRIDSLRREIQILQAVDHPNIIKLYDIYEDDKYLHLVMELCEGGELFDRIIAKTQSAEGHYSEVECAKLVQKILRAINYCHTIHNICHRDLKPENFIFKTKAEDSEMKIIDFGLSRYEDEAGSKMTTRVGTPYYISPEVLARRYDKACDLWSIGVITYILICGYPPFYGDTDAEIFESVRKGRFTFPSPEWDDITRPAKTFIKSLLNKDPTARPTAEQALQHEWLARTLSAGFEARPFNFAQMNTALRQFMGMSNLKKVALNVIAHQTAEADVAHLTALFEALDQDGNGVITVDELQGALGRAGASPRTSQGLSAALRAADIDASDALDYREFLAATMDQRVYTQEGNLRKAFRYFDLGRTGCITREDLVRIFGSEEQAHQILGDVDRDQDGQISYEEFKRMMVESFTPRRHPGAVAGATGAFFQGPAIASGGGGGGMAQAAADPNRATPGVLSNTPKNPGSRRPTAVAAHSAGAPASAPPPPSSPLAPVVVVGTAGSGGGGKRRARSSANNSAAGSMPSSRRSSQTPGGGGGDRRRSRSGADAAEQQQLSPLRSSGGKKLAPAALMVSSSEARLDPGGGGGGGVMPRPLALSNSDSKLAGVGSASPDERGTPGRRRHRTLTDSGAGEGQKIMAEGLINGSTGRPPRLRQLSTGGSARGGGDGRRGSGSGTPGGKLSGLAGCEAGATKLPSLPRSPGENGPLSQNVLTSITAPQSQRNMRLASGDPPLRGDSACTPVARKQQRHRGTSDLTSGRSGGTSTTAAGKAGGGILPQVAATTAGAAGSGKTSSRGRGRGGGGSPAGASLLAIK